MEMNRNYSELYNTILSELKAAKTSKRMTDAGIKKRIGICGLSAEDIYYIFLGKITPSIENISNIATALGYKWQIQLIKEPRP